MTEDTVTIIDLTKAPSPKQKGKGYRWFRLTLWTLGILLVLAGGGLWMVTRSWFIVRQIEPELSRKLGGEVTIASASYEGDGRFILSDIHILAPDIAGPASEVARIDRAMIVLDMGQLWRGEIRVYEVALSEVTLRISEDARNSGGFNVMAFKPDWKRERKSGTVFLPPMVTLEDVALEFGSHESGAFTLMGERLVEGEIKPNPNDGEWYDFTLSEVDGGAPGKAGLDMTGSWNVTTNEFRGRLNEITLDDQLFSVCPNVARVWWVKMGLEGKLDQLEVRWLKDEPFRVEFTLEDMGLTLPIQAEGFWARYEGGVALPSSGLPRMRVESGSILLEQGQLMLKDLQGELIGSGQESGVVGVPYSISATISEIPPLVWSEREAWTERVFSESPFVMTMEMIDFRVTPDEMERGRAVELPRVVARVLEQFELTQWALSTKVEIRREVGTVDDSGATITPPIHSSGTAFISRASGAYRKFPYPLENIEAYVEINDNTLTIHELTGIGAAGAALKLSGTVILKGKESEANLLLSAQGLPLDDHLRDALSPRVRPVFARFLDRAAYRSLGEADLLSDENREGETRSQLAVAEDALAELNAEDEEYRYRLENRVERLRRVLDLGSFELGGLIDLNLQINRSEATGYAPKLNGEVNLQRIGLLYDVFPYPFVVDEGVLTFEEDLITLGRSGTEEGISFVTLGGGHGAISGTIEMRNKDGDRSIIPDLLIEFGDDEYNPLIGAAIPLTKNEREEAGDDLRWPGMTLARSASWLENVGLTGPLQFHGVVNTDDSNKINYDLTVGLEHGRAIPTEKLTTAMALAGMEWPDDLALTAVQGVLRINPGVITLESLEANRGDGVVRGTGVIELTGESPQTSVEVSFEDIPLEQYLVNLVPQDGLTKARELWDRFQPRGAYDATFLYRVVGGVPEPVVLTVQPRALHARIGEQEMSFQFHAGELALSNQQVGFEEFEFEVMASGKSEGIITLTGSYGNAGRAGGRGGRVADGVEVEKALSARGTWTGGDLSSSLIREVLSLIGAANLTREYEAYQPEGQFNAEFHYDSPGAVLDGGFGLTLHPQSLNARFRGEHIALRLNPDSVIEYGPNRISIPGLSGQHAGGTFRLDGQLDFDEKIMRGDLRFDYDGSLASSQFRVFLPQRVKDIADALALKDGESSRIEGGALRFTSNLDDPASLFEEALFTSRLRLGRAAFTAGVDFEDVRGEFGIQVKHQKEKDPEVIIAVTAENMRVFGQVVTAGVGTLRLNPGDDFIALENFVGDAHGGVMWAEGFIGVGENKEYEVQVELAGSSLGALFGSPESEDGSASSLEGKVYGDLTLAGERGKGKERRGRGVVRILGGRVGDVPVAMRISNLLNFTLSPQNKMDYINADFYILGSRMFFESIVMESTWGNIANNQIVGGGYMNLGEYTIDLRLHQRGGWKTEIPLIPQLFEIGVTGTLRKPEVELIILPGLQKTAGG